jgi:type IV pilus assembly protein PilC
MPEFQCRVATTTGEVFERSYVAEDESALRRDLENQDLMILNVSRRSALLQQVVRAVRLRSAVSNREFLIFNQELSALVRAGLPIVPTLDMLLERRKNATFKQALQDVRDRVKSGESLSEAFAAQGDLFPNLYSASLASGERSGELASVLQRFIAYMQKLLTIQRRVVSALIYPLILLTLACGLIALLLFYIIPKFNTFLEEFGAELPLITEILIGVATFCTEHWQIILTLVVAVVISLLVWRKTQRGRMFLDQLKLRLPLVGQVVHDYAQNRFTRTLGTLQAGGIPLVTSLELAARATGNAVFERELLDVVVKVREGKALWESLDATGLLSDIAIQMIKVGESTGSLDEMLEQTSDFADEEIDTQLTRLVSLVEPLMLVFMAVVVAIMLLSIYLPLVQAYGGTRGM